MLHRRAPICAVLALLPLLSAQAAPTADEARARVGSQPGAIGQSPIDLSADTVRSVRAVRTAPGRVPHLKVAVSEGDPVPLPLEETRVFAEVSGFVARVDVAQTYSNPFAEPIEAIYTFPLPENSAVDDMTMRIGDRVVRAEIQKRADAKRTYAAAKRAGHTAALLEQERPNIFTQSVVNIAPGERIEVTLSYVQTLSYEAGTYEFVFPMVVGPRFVPGTPIAGASGTGWSPDTDEVPDASRITPPVIGAGQRTGHDIDIEVLLDPGFPLVDFDAVTHEVDAVADADGTMNVRLSSADRIPNRDFVLRYRVDGWMPQARSMAAAGPGGGDGVVSVVVQPPRLPVETLVGRREVVFVVDVSGSMRGIPLSQAKAAMRRALRRLSPSDTFNVYTFAGMTSRAFAAPRAANHTNIEQAVKWLDARRAGGGTYLADAVQQALRPEMPEGRHRYVVFLTDGFVGNESAIMGAAEALVQASNKTDQRARVFGMGIGSSPNRHLIEGLAKAGDGASMYVTLDEQPDGAIDRLYRTIDHPVLTDVRIDWGDLPVTAVEPAVMPDLLATAPLVIMGRYTAPGSGIVTVHAKHDGKDVSLPVKIDLPAGGEQDRHRALPSLWARARVETLSRKLWRGHDAKVIEQITDLGLQHRLVTAYTSFVAVDRSRVVGDGAPKTVVQPVEPAAGVDMAAAAPAAARYGGEMADKVSSAELSRMVVDGSGGGTFGVGDSLGFGGLGTVGRGGGGGGMGYGRGSSGGFAAGAKAKRRPRARVIAGKAVVTGSLDKDVIRRVVRARRRGVQYCYEKTLARKPELAGKLVMRWTIGPDGRVMRSEVAEDELGDKGVSDCVARAIKRWRFPAPKGGGVVVVSYPFIFKPAK